MLAMMAIRTSEAAHEKLSGFSNIYIGMSPQPIVFGVTDGHLIFGSSADAIALCLATAAGDHPTVRENAQLMKEALIPDGAFVSVSFKNERKFGEQLTQAVAVVSMVGGMAAMAVPEPEAQKAITKVLGIVAKLGPLASKIDFYRSTAEYETFDGRMWRSRSVTNYAPPKDRGVRADAGK